MAIAMVGPARTHFFDPDLLAAIQQPLAGIRIANSLRQAKGLNVPILLPPSRRPIFKPREVADSDGRHWYVEAEWPDGTVDEIGRFGSITECWDWIARQSRAWAAGREGG